MTTTPQYCEAYRGWHIWFEPGGGYVAGEDKSAPWDAEGYFGTREEARKDIDWILDHLQHDTPLDSPCLDAPWWEHR